MMVGTESRLLNTLKSLIALDFAAIIAYRAAIKRLEDEMYQRALQRFVAEHVAHTQELAPFIEEHGGLAPAMPDAKTILTKGKLLARQTGGDLEILAVMHANEGDTNTVYEYACLDPQTPPKVRDFLRRALGDERRHKAWLECILGQDRPFLRVGVPASPLSLL